MRAEPASRRRAAASRPASTASSARLSSRVSPSPIRMPRRPALARAANPTRSPDRSMRLGRLMRAGKPRASSASIAPGSTRRAFSPSAASRSRRAARPTRSASARPAPSAIAFASPPHSARRSSSPSPGYPTRARTATATPRSAPSVPVSSSRRRRSSARPSTSAPRPASISTPAMAGSCGPSCGSPGRAFSPIHPRRFPRSSAIRRSCYGIRSPDATARSSPSRSRGRPPACNSLPAMRASSAPTPRRIKGDSACA